MAYDDSRLPAEAAHHILLEGREQLTVSGVEEVESFDENTIVMSTVKGTLVVRGEDLHIEKLSLDGGDMKVEGRVDSLTYEDDRRGRGGLLSRPGGGSGPGGAAGAGRRDAVRPVPHPAGAGAPPPAGPGAGPAVLADAHRDPVSLVSVGLGRAGAPVRGGVSVPGRGGLLRAVQPLAALAGVPAGRPDYSNS